MCECVPPPPLFDLPPPPDPSLIWRELALLDEPIPSNATKQHLDEEVQLFEQFFRNPAGSCSWLDDGALNVLDTVVKHGNFWDKNFGGDGSLNRFYYLLSVLFLLLFFICCAAIFALRLRTNKSRLKGSQRSTPSLNSSKLSTETVGTATATMVASMGSGGHSGGCGSTTVATLLNTTTNNGNNCNNNGSGKNRLPQTYHSATISRRAFAPVSHHYCMQYHTQQQQQPLSYLCHNGCQASCCGCKTSPTNCCYADQQKRIYSSQSATNIFGNICLPPQQQQQRIQHVQCLNNNGQISNYLQQQQIVHNTVNRNAPRCAALRVQNQSPHLSLLMQPANFQIPPSDGWQQQIASGSYCTMPYEYEEIENSNNGPYMQNFGCDDADNTTVFEDLSENLRQLEQQRQSHNSQTYKQRLPPPAGRPPPIPAKRNLAEKCKNETPSHGSATYQTPPPAPHRHVLISPTSFATDAELQNLTENKTCRLANSPEVFCYKQQQPRNDESESTRCDSYDRTCDDATSLAASADDSEAVGVNNSPADIVANNDNNYQQQKQLQQSQQKPADSTNELENGRCEKNGRESGYGTGKDRALISHDDFDVANRLRLSKRDSLPPYKKVVYGSSNDGRCEDQLPYPQYASPTMTYV